MSQGSFGSWYVLFGQIAVSYLAEEQVETSLKVKRHIEKHMWVVSSGCAAELKQPPSPRVPPLNQ